MDTVPHRATRVMPQRTQILQGHFLAIVRFFVTRHQSLGNAMP